jgi:CPA1 family monovalent cation:H+ antiporter
MGWLFERAIRQFSDTPSAIILQFCGTFGVWILAEAIGLSGILTIVVYAITIARTAPIRTPARVRVPSYAVWETAVFLLNALAFVMVGLQLRPILERLTAVQRLDYGLVAAAVLATVVLVRIAWVMGYNALIQAKIARFGFRPRRHMARPTAQGALVVSWAGMRGIVTLAAAFALPMTLADGSPFPYRDLIVLTAFCVVLGTLIVQGLTLRPLILALELSDGDPVAQEIGEARMAAYRAAIEAIEDDSSRAAVLLRKEYGERLRQAELGQLDGANSAMPTDSLRQRAIEAARRKAFEFRATGAIGDDAFHVLEEEFDRAELTTQQPSVA